MNCPEPLPYKGQPFYKPKQGKTFQEAMYAFLFNPKRVFLSVAHADLSADPELRYVFADCDTLPQAYGTGSMEDIRKNVPPDAAPLIIWEDDLAKALPKKKQVVPLRRLLNDYLKKDYSNWHSPYQFYTDVLLAFYHMNLPSVIWPDTFPKKKEPFEYKRLLVDCELMENMLKLIAESYYRINFEDF